MMVYNDSPVSIVSSVRYQYAQIVFCYVYALACQQVDSSSHQYIVLNARYLPSVDLNLMLVS